MKKIIVGLLALSVASVAFAKGTAVYYVAKQKIHASAAKRTELYGNLEGGCGPYGCVYMDLITYPDGTSEANYKCGTSGTWSWVEYNPNASGFSEVPEGSLSEGSCYQLNDPRIPVLPDLYLQ